MTGEQEPIRYLSADDILAMHELVVEVNDDTVAGVASPGDVEYVADTVREGHFGQAPESTHETAYQLLRLLVANHPFVDGNKRTALMAVRIFYVLNGLAFDYDRRIKEILKELATDEAAVAAETVLSYFRTHTEPLSPEYRATIERWLTRIEVGDHPSESVKASDTDGQEDEPNDYDDSTPTGG